MISTPLLRSVAKIIIFKRFMDFYGIADEFPHRLVTALLEPWTARRVGSAVGNGESTVKFFDKLRYRVASKACASFLAEKYC